jgi:hypothetical protein
MKTSHVPSTVDQELVGGVRGNLYVSSINDLKTIILIDAGQLGRLILAHVTHIAT